MKKGLKNSLITLGLTGAIALTGCQNPTYWSVPNQKGQTTYETKPSNLGSRSNYSFERARISYPEEGKVEVPVKENKTDFLQDVTTYSTPVYNESWTAQQRPSDPIGFFIGYTLVSSLTVGLMPTFDIIMAMSGNPEKTEFYGMSCRQLNQTRIPRTSRRTSRTVSSYENTEDKGARYTKTSEGPARGAPVEILGSNLEADGKILPTTKRTDSEGKLKTIVSPVRGYLNPTEAVNFSKGILNETYKPGKLEELVGGLPLFTEEAHSLTLKTKGDELSINYPVYQSVDLRAQINQRIRSQLEAHLSGKFPMKEIPVEVIQKGDEIPLRDVRVKSRSTSGPTTETVLAEEKKFLGDFFRYPADTRELIINPANYISTFPENFVINERISAKINQDCVVNLKLIHPGHYAQTVNISIKDTNGKIIAMPRLPAPVEQQEAAEDANKGSITEIQKN